VPTARRLSQTLERIREYQCTRSRSHSLQSNGCFRFKPSSSCPSFGGQRTAVARCRSCLRAGQGRGGFAPKYGKSILLIYAPSTRTRVRSEHFNRFACVHGRVKVGSTRVLFGSHGLSLPVDVAAQCRFKLAVLPSMRSNPSFKRTGLRPAA